VRGDGSDRTERRRGAHLYRLKAESIAALLLRFKGYTILAKRFVVSGGEIDLIARRGGSIAFVEVKARAALEVAATAISATKRRHRPRCSRVAHTKPMGRRVDVARRRRLRRAGTVSPPRAGRL
jgi:Holliday junction resolvase-like predicted endonuclease